MNATNYDAILIVSFGGPEKPEDVMPFLENVLRGKNVPRERMVEVAEHYYHFGGKSPINDQNRQLISALGSQLKEYGPQLPVYWGNRNWHPMLADTLQEMKSDGVRRALAFVTSAYSSYSSCRQYREDIDRARALVGEGAPVVDKIRVFYNHPGFVEATLDRVGEAFKSIPHERRRSANLVFTAHSIPLSMAQGCDYQSQLNEIARLVAVKLDHENWRLVYQSRSGPPSQAWLGPDILDYLREIKDQGNSRDVVIAPIGFVSNHMEVLFDLDTQAHELCSDLGLNMVRAATVGTHPRFIGMIRELVLERLNPTTPRLSLGKLGPRPDSCVAGCCALPPRPADVPLSQRSKPDSMAITQPSGGEVLIREFQPGDEAAFRDLNEEWITRYFRIEAKDREAFTNPQEKILKAGGRIFFATLEGNCVGCCALLRIGDDEFEVAKMAVTSKVQGAGIGRKVLHATIEAARASGARRLYLETNHILEPAIRLYESAGFKHLPPEKITPSVYDRADVYMEKILR